MVCLVVECCYISWLHMLAACPLRSGNLCRQQRKERNNKLHVIAHRSPIRASFCAVVVQLGHPVAYPAGRSSRLTVSCQIARL